MKLRRQQQVERELNGYRAWIDRAGTGQQNNFMAFITVSEEAGFCDLLMETGSC